MFHPMSNTKANHPNPDTTTQQPTHDAQGRLIHGYLFTVLHVVQTLLGYGQHFAATLHVLAGKKEFATVAAATGTFNVDLIAARIQRGILRAIALRNYLLQRAAKGRDIVPHPPQTGEVMLVEDWLAKRAAEEAAAKAAAEAAAKAAQTQSAPPAPPASEKPVKLGPATPPFGSQVSPDHPSAFRTYTLEELEKEVRSRPIARTILDIVNDFAIIPGFCTSDFFTLLFDVLRNYGDQLGAWVATSFRRNTDFQKENDRRPQSWGYDWRDFPREKVRAVLGCLVGEPPPTTVPS